MKTIDWWVSTKFATGRMTVQGDTIIDTPPIWKKFKGQKWMNFLNWIGKYDPIIESLGVK